MEHILFLWLTVFSLIAIALTLLITYFAFYKPQKSEINDNSQAIDILDKNQQVMTNEIVAINKDLSDLETEVDLLVGTTV